MFRLTSLLLFVSLWACVFGRADVIKNDIDWSGVEKVLQDAIADQAFPGCVAIVADEKGYLFAKAFGNYTYGVPPPLNGGTNPPVTLDSIFDLASITKVVGATSAIAQFYQRGELNLNTKIVDILGPAFGQNGKGPITVLHCLLHNTGLPPGPYPTYSQKAFGCPETDKHHPLENFSCQQKIYDSLLAQKLSNPIGTKYVYSDLSLMTLSFVVGRLARTLGYIKEDQLIPECFAANPHSEAADQCYFEAYLRKHVFEPLKMTNTGYRPSESIWPNIVPAENDTHYRHRVIQGQVHDGNSYAAGGIAGHAGIFSNAHDLHTLMHRVLFAPETDNVFINRTTAKLFTREYDNSQSSRALGWNTNDPTVFDRGWDLLCGKMSPKTFTHVGYTGTQACGDPERNIITILLTHRVYPTSANTKIGNVRRAFNTAVVAAWDAHNS